MKIDLQEQAAYNRLLTATKAAKILFEESCKHRELFSDRTVYWTLSRICRAIDYLIAILEKFHSPEPQYT